MKRLLFIVSAFIVFQTMVFISNSHANSTWQQLNGPYGGIINALAVDPADSQVVYASIGGNGGIYKTVTGGSNWTKVSTLLVDALAIDPVNRQTIYAVGADVYKSVDGGGSWNQMINGIPTTTIRTMAIDPVNSQTIYVGSQYGGVFKTVNGGNSWNAVNSGLTTTWISSLKVDPSNSQIVYAGTQNSGVFKTVNGGSSWSAVNSGLTLTTINTLAIDPSNSQNIYAGTISVAPGSSGLFKSVNGGSSWNVVSYNSLTNNWIHNLAFDPTNSQTIYAGTNGSGIYKSTNSGSSWSQVSSGVPAVWTLSMAIAPSNSQIVYAGTSSGGIYKTVNGGSSWNEANGTLPASINSLAVDPTNSQTMYAGTGGDIIFKSINGGSSWNKLSMGTTPGINELAIDPENSQIMYVGGGNGYMSVNGGNSWSSFNVGILASYANIQSLVLDPSDNQTIYVGTSDQGIIKTINGGNSWTAMNNGLTTTAIKSLVIAPANSQIIYAGSPGDGVFKTVNGGANWNVVNNGLTSKNIWSMAIDPVNSQTLYVGTSGSGSAIYKTINGGNSWNVVSSGISNGGSIFSLAVDPINSQTIYAGTHTGGVFMSVNGGNNWNVVNGGLPSDTISTLAIDPSNNQIIYAGTWGNGVYKLATNSDSLALSLTRATFAPTAGGTLSTPTAFTLSNGGASTVAVSGISIIGNDATQFSVSPGGSAPCASHTPTLAAGTSCTVNVIFAPNSVGAKSATLRVTSNDTANQVLTAALSGTAILPSFSIDSIVTGSGGTLYCTSPVEQGASSLCTITPFTGFVLSTLTDNGADVKGQVSGTTYAVNSVTANHTVTATFADTIAPTISAFTIPSSATSLTIAINTFTATDNTAVTGYCLTETNNSTGCVWTASKPTSYTFGSTGSKTLYAFVKDASGNISTSASATVTTTLTDITTPTISAFTLPANSSGLTVTIATFTATDNVAVTGYCLTETNNATGCIWAVAKPASYTFSTVGSKTLYAFARDASGNISTSASAPVTVSLADTTPPVVSAGPDQTKGAQFTQTGIASDANPLTYAWSKQTGPGTIIFGSPSAISTAISASANGTYTIRLTAADVAGNSASSEMTLVWDTALPTTLSDGDLNNDGAVTIADALRAMQIAVGLIAPTATDLAKGDVAPLVSGRPAPDGKINTGDAVVVLQKVIGTVSW